MSEEAKKVKKPKSKARKIIEWVLTGLFVAIFAVLGVAQIDGMVHKKDHYNQTIRFGYGTFVVQTESMEPKYKVKSAIVTYLDSPEQLLKRYNKGETIDITFFDAYQANNENTLPNAEKNPALTDRTPATGLPMTHRLQELKKGEDGHYYFFTAGINTGVSSVLDNEGRVKQYQVFTEKELLGRVVIGSAFLGGVFGFVSSVWGLLILLLIPAFYLVITSVIDIFKAYKEPAEAKESTNSNSGETTKSGTLELSEADKKRLKEELLEEMLNKKKGGN